MPSLHATAQTKPSKPYETFPLFPHATGRWAKKIRGKLHYFGQWADADGALARYEAQKADLHAGRRPKEAAEGVRVRDLASEFLKFKQGRVEAGELSPRTYAEYKRITDELVAHMGKNRLVSDLRQDDFAKLRIAMTKKWGPHRITKAVQYTRSVFVYGFKAELIPAMRWGPGFERPTKKTLRLHRARQGQKLFTREQVLALVDGALVVGRDGPELVQANPALRAMLLLGINCGFGNTDCGSLPRDAADLARGWIDFPRPKTGIPRRCPLWPETCEAIRVALEHRPEAKAAEDVDLIFITKYGLSWCKDTSTNPVSQETAKLLRALGFKVRKGIGFYTLRHTFRTQADNVKDQPAADFIMGHESEHMSTTYREGIADERLKAITDHVRKWLWT